MAGILILGAFSNYGNLPIAVTSSVMEYPPFDKDTDAALAVSYIFAFVLTMNTLFFACGLSRIIVWDYRSDTPHGKDAEVHLSWTEKPLFIAIKKLARSGKPQVVELPKSENLDLAITIESPSDENEARAELDKSELTEAGPALEKRPTQIPLQSRLTKYKLVARNATAAFVTAPNVALVFSIVIAVIDPIRALFTPTTGYSFHGPTGDAPLAFVIQTGQFVGALGIPLALVQLGASFADALSDSRASGSSLSRLPWASILAMSMCKVCVYSSCARLITI